MKWELHKFWNCNKVTEKLIIRRNYCCDLKKIDVSVKTSWKLCLNRANEMTQNTQSTKTKDENPFSSELAPFTSSFVSLHHSSERKLLFSKPRITRAWVLFSEIVIVMQEHSIRNEMIFELKTIFIQSYIRRIHLDLISWFLWHAPD